MRIAIVDDIIARLQKFEPHIYAALRIVAGAMFAFHGGQKLFGGFGRPPTDDAQLWIGGFIELVGGALIALGLFTRAAAFFASGTMAVAYIQFHWKLDMSGYKWLPLVNKGELAVLYCFVFLLFVVKGSGIGSMDRALFGKR